MMNDQRVRARTPSLPERQRLERALAERCGGLRGQEVKVVSAQIFLAAGGPETDSNGTPKQGTPRE